MGRSPCATDRRRAQGDKASSHTEKRLSGDPTRTFALVLLAACTGAHKVTTTTLTDQGTVCLQNDGTLFMDFQTCLFSSCDTLVSQSCSATLDGSTLTVTSEAVIDSQGQVCTADCGLVQGTCTSV